MSNTVNLGNGKWAIKDSELLGYSLTDDAELIALTLDVSRASSGTRVNASGLIETLTKTLSGELVTNGDFATDSDWTKQSNWNISNGKANSNGTGLIYQTSVSYVNGKTYKVTFNVNMTSGSGTVRLGNTSTSTPFENGLNEFYLQTDVSNTTKYIFFQGNSFVGSIDNVSVVEVNQKNLARIDYSDSTDGVLLTEPQSTNFVTDSEDFSGWLKTSGGTTTAAYGISPSGLQDATRIQFSTSNDQVYIGLGVHSGNTEVASLYVKGVSGETVQFGVGVNIGQGITISLNGDWQRITQESTSGSVLIIGSKDATTRDIQVWGAQVEEQSYATSYMPTYGQIASRASDLINNGGEAINFNSEEGVLFAEIAALANATPQEVSFAISEGQSGANRLLIRMKTNGAIGVVLRVANTTQADINSSALNQSVSHKVAVKWKLNDIALWIDGVEVGTDSLANVFPANTLDEVSFNQGNNSNPFYGKTKSLQVFKEALTDAQLITLTTI